MVSALASQDSVLVLLVDLMKVDILENQLDLLGASHPTLTHLVDRVLVLVSVSKPTDWCKSPENG